MPLAPAAYRCEGFLLPVLLWAGAMIVASIRQGTVAHASNRSNLMAFKTVSTPPQVKPNRANPPAVEREGSAPQKQRSRRPGQWGLAVRIGVSLILAWHIMAVFLAPLSIPPSSQTVGYLAQGTFMQWYLDALFLNHGYHFFAPDPGPGHLIRYQVFDERGSVIAQGEFPNKKEDWPRLLYHRYFMLAEQCYVPAASEAESQRWMRTYLAAYARQLLREHGGASVRVQRIIHYPAILEDVVGGMPLDDPRTYRLELEVTQHRQDLDLPLPNQARVWNQNQWRRDVASGWQGGVR